MPNTWWPGVTTSYSYIQAPNISSVEPNKTSTYGNEIVLIRGESLADDTSDVLEVRLAGIAVKSINYADFGLINVTAHSAPGAVTGDVYIKTYTRGSGRLVNGFIYYVPTEKPQITAVYPEIGPRAGGQIVKITGYWMCDNTVEDIMNITMAGVPVQSIINATSSAIYVISGPSQLTSHGVIIIHTISRGMLRSTATYMYPPDGMISKVSPNKCVYTGGCSSMIYGTNMYRVVNGSHDVTSVKICGNDANVVKVTVLELNIELPAGQVGQGKYRVFSFVMV